MNTPNRYHLWAALECHAFSKAEAVLRFSAEEDGMWVQYQDYARLKAEVERLTAEVSFDKRVQLHVDKLVAEFTQCQVERLQAEVERLRKAGDVMADAAYAHCMCQHCEELRDQWRDAKRGNQP